MIYDCFTFFNELDLLEIRLHILDPIVDVFVIVEATKTHTGFEKPLLFEQNKSRFTSFLNKICYIIVDDFPDLHSSEADSFNNRWLYENYQRDAILRGLTDAKDSDTILISDLDEIPNPKYIKKHLDYQGIISFDMKVYNYYLNYTSTEENFKKSRMMPYSFLKNTLDNWNIPQPLCFSVIEKYRYGTNPNKIRCYPGDLCIPNSGWHFSYLNINPTAILAKRTSIVEQQYNTTENMNQQFMQDSIKNGDDVLGRGYKMKAVLLSSQFPEYIRKNKKKYQHLLYPITLTYFLNFILPENLKRGGDLFVCFGKSIIKKTSLYQPLKKMHGKIKNG